MSYLTIRDVAVRHTALVVRRQDEVFAALAFIHACDTHILDRHLPHIHERSDNGTALSRRQIVPTVIKSEQANNLEIQHIPAITNTILL